MASTQIRPPSPADSRGYALLEEQATRIQSQIHELQGQLADVRARQNALMPVNRTPDEVLSAILAHLVQPASAEVIDEERNRCDLVAASHVCGRWRKVAIDNLALWTEIPLCARERATLFLERSQHMPVHICYDRCALPDDGVPKTAYARLVVPHIPRLRALSLHHLYPPEQVTWWMSQLGAAVPALEELSLSVDDLDVRFSDPPALDGNTPSLRKLSLHHVIFPPSHLLYRHLRYLSISTLALDVLKVSELLQILRCTAELEGLELRGLFPNEGDSEGVEDASIPPHPGPVTLARLSTLKAVNVPSRPLQPLLAHLALPVNTQITIDIGYSRYEPGFVLPRNEAMLPALVNLRALVTVFAVSSDKGVSFTLRGKRDPSEDAPWSFSLHARAYAQAPAEILDARAVESYKMTIEGDTARNPYGDFGDPYEHPWEDALQGLDALKTLSVHGCEYFQRYADLFRVLAEHRDTPPRPSMCPSLKELEIVRVHCNEYFWTQLRGMLHSRRASGCPLRSVRLKEATGAVDVTGPFAVETRGLLDDLQIETVDAVDAPL